MHKRIQAKYGLKCRNDLLNLFMQELKFPYGISKELLAKREEH